jgi:uncharacterized protein HemX
MADDQTESDAPTAASTPKPPQAANAPRRSGGSISAGLALILAAIALTGSAYLWFVLVYERQDLLAIDVPGKLARIENDNRDFREALDATDIAVSELRDTQDVLKAGFDKIQSDFAHNRAEWVLAETERLLLVANHRLQLARDARAALAALRAADQQLNLLTNPKYLPIRREIAREITALEALEKTDIAGIALKLAGIAEGIDRLPLASDARRAAAPTLPKSAAAPAENWRHGAHNLWDDLLGLVRIRTDLEIQKPLLPPEQSYFVRENVRLMLFGAQQALLQGNVTVYRHNLKIARTWLKDHYDTGAQAVAATLAELESLHNAPITADLPDISASLEVLRGTTGKGGGA